MRDISSKINTRRTATAEAILTASPETIRSIQESRVPKGDPLSVSKVAAVQAAKNTPLLLPYCHTVPVDYVGVEFELTDDAIHVTATVKAIHKTGVEMEALTAASVAALNLYDMLKALDGAMEIKTVRLLEQEGGKSDYCQSFASDLKAFVLVISDSVALGKKADRSGQLLVKRLQDEGLTVAEYGVVADEPEAIRAAVRRACDDMRADLVITTGGTGVSPRDITPEAVQPLLDRTLPGITEAIRRFGQDRTPYAMLSRSLAGTRGKTLILCLPGSTGGVRDALDALFPAVLHAYKMLWGGGHPEKESASCTPVAAAGGDAG
jgi:cyclic pyranopterin phosphate synthase